MCLFEREAKDKEARESFTVSSMCLWWSRSQIASNARDTVQIELLCLCSVVKPLSCLFTTNIKDVVDPAESPPQGQGDANFDAVSTSIIWGSVSLKTDSGLDNAGKTTIVKKIMNEDVNSVSPTLGFIIKTIDYDG